MDDHSRYLSWTLSFLAGGLAGAGLGLLLAPRSGRNTRQIMRRTVRGGTDSAREIKDRLVRRGRRIREETERRAGEAASILAGRRSAAGNAGGVASTPDTHDRSS